ncbi:MAG: hypothetical protein ACRC0X_03145 [Brevinema sp.]
MRKDLIIGLAIGLTIGILGTVIFSQFSKSDQENNGGKSTLSLALPQIEKLDEHYLAKIENFGISVNDFTNAYELVKQNLPPEQQVQFSANEAAAKAEILETMINQYAVVATAIEEGFLENEENLQLFRNAAQQALFNLYLTQNMPQNENVFIASQPEIDQAYAQYGAELRARGLNAQQSREFLVTQITQQKRQRWMLDFVGKVKEGFRVERNNVALETQGISTIRTPFTPIQ